MTAQTWDPARYEKNARFVSDLGQAVVDLIAPRSGERILDLGCGDGALTRRLADAGCQVVAIDSSYDQVEAARIDGEARVPWYFPTPAEYETRLRTAGFEEYLREVRDALEPKLRDASGSWIADYVRLRFAAIKPGRTR
jgi:SAM-dependent methyltransferase